MQFSKSNIVVNGIWKPVLIVTDDKPIKDFPNNVVVEENDYYITNYYTDGVYKTFEEDGKFINWYLINGQVVKEKQTARIEALETQNADLAEAIVNLQFEQETEKLGGNI